MDSLPFLNRSHSGYVPGNKQWASFLSCWKKTFLSLDAQPFGDFLKFEKPDLKRLKKNSLSTGRAEKFPQSFLDFHASYALMGGKYRQAGLSYQVGIFNICDIELLSDYHPQLYDSRLTHSVDADNSSYYKYGIEQDYGATKKIYNETALVVAQYSFDDSELMLLYPDSKTLDGEMEVAILGKAWEFRAPSFAEMMRQISMYCLLDPDSLPPYKQSLLNKTCADSVSLVDVWWK